MSDDSYGETELVVPRDLSKGSKRLSSHENGENKSKKSTGYDFDLEPLRRNMELMNAESERIKQLNDLISLPKEETVENEEDSTLTEEPSGEPTERNPLKLDLNVSDMPLDAEEIDKNSIYIGNVDYSSTAEEVEDHFKNCGRINRVTIMVDFKGKPKGYAYMQFEDESAVVNALEYNETEFKGRTIKVTVKRKNQPFHNRRGGSSMRRGFAPFRRFGRYRARRGWFY